MNDNNKSFTLSLALVDALPVIFFSCAIAVLARNLNSPVFLAGAVLCILAGAGKVLWKILLATVHKDIPWLGAQLRYVMPVGFLLIIVGTFMADRNIVRGLMASAVRLPAALFFILALVGIAGMIICAAKFDRRDVGANWIEQWINSFAQGCVLIGVLLL